MAHPPKHHGTLYLMPVWLGPQGGAEQLPPENLAIAARIGLWFAENERTARRLLLRMVPGLDPAAIAVHRFDKESNDADARALLALMADGRDAAIVSEAGMPAIADPGARMVRAAHAAGIAVVPLAGPSALLLALAASGLNGQRFTFHGYLPREAAARRKAIERIEAIAQREGSAQLFIETPYRNAALLAGVLRTCAPATLLTLAVDLMQPGGWVRTQRIGLWRNDPPAIDGRPTVFILGREDQG